MEDERASLGLATRDVVDIVKPFYNKGYHVYTDRFYTSPVLLHYLQRYRVYSCGTVMSDRKFFLKDFTERALPHGDSQWRQDHNSGMVVTVWMDRKPIYFLSNIHVAEDPYIFVVKHGQKGNDLIFTTPPCVLDYNKNMGSVAFNDKMTGIDRSRKTHRWPHRLYRKGIFEVIYNAFVIEDNFAPHFVPGNERET